MNKFIEYYEEDIGTFVCYTAIEYLQIKMEEFKTAGDNQSVAKYLHGIAEAYGEMGMLDERDSILRQSLEIYTNIGDKKGMTKVYMDLAAFVKRSEKFEIYDTLLKLYEELNDKIGMLSCLQDLAECQEASGNKKSAKETMQRIKLLEGNEGE